MSAPKTDNCPFCGGDKHMVLPPNCTKTGDYNPGDNAQPIVRCMTCYAEAMGSPWDYTKESAVTAWNRRTDLSQAAVAAALEAAWIATRNVICSQDWTDCDGDVFCDTIAAAIRALITPAQHDALAAHVAAEVAKARAEDAAKLLKWCDSIQADVFGCIDLYANEEANSVLWLNNFRAEIAQIGAKP